MADYRSPWMDDELDLFRDAARRFVESEILPHDARFREQHHVDRELWNKAGEVGLLVVRREEVREARDARGHVASSRRPTTRQRLSGMGIGTGSMTNSSSRSRQSSRRIT